MIESLLLAASQQSSFNMAVQDEHLYLSDWHKLPVLACLCLNCNNLYLGILILFRLIILEMGYPF